MLNLVSAPVALYWPELKRWREYFGKISVSSSPGKREESSRAPKIP